MPNMHVDTMPAPSQRWMYSLPGIDGHYWYQHSAGGSLTVVEIYTDPDGMMRIDFQRTARTYPLGQMSGRWLGPIAPPMAHEAWRPEDERMPADATLSNFEKVGNYLAGAVYTDFDAYQHNEADLAVIEPVCQYPGCCEPAVCRAPNFADRLVCAEHLAIVNGTAAYKTGINKPVRQQR